MFLKTIGNYTPIIFALPTFAACTSFIQHLDTNNNLSCVVEAKKKEFNFKNTFEF